MERFNQNIVKTFVLLVLASISLTVDGAPSNCMVGKICERCPAGHFKMVKLGSKNVKVCCPGCNKYCVAGNRESDGRPYCTCYNPEEIIGTCWKGQQCETCLNGANKTYVGSINTIPVCCKHCERSGLMLGGKLCNCLHNGP